MRNGTDGQWELPFTLVYGVIIPMGLVLNVVALWVFCHDIRLRSGTTVYMKNLATADLLLVCFLPIRLVYITRSGDVAQLVCEVTSLIFLVNMYTSIFFLACISLDRCIATLWPLRLPLRRLHHAAPWVSAVVWLLSVGASLPPYLILKLRSNKTTNHSCRDHDAVTNRLTVSFTLSIGFGLPFALLLVCSLLALRSVRSSGRLDPHLKKARKTQNMILANLLIFTFCFLPYHAMLPFYGNLQRRSNRTAHLLYHAAQLLASSNAALDPILYYFSTEAFQKTQLMATVGAVVSCRCRRRRRRKDTGTPVPTDAENVTFISTVKTP
ncbi:lysophosphatidic acid receptor 4-like [Amblyraja radiata]|uniref:lysophosphatidic acid receptor 4-like n=1 Tax=Amblyraja radiata TaxID=386614 RepID=UPI00140328C3|nr:lysophosphatidic acid receptor 4-like [Amblyraja radiata]